MIDMMLRVQLVLGTLQLTLTGIQVPIKSRADGVG